MAIAAAVVTVTTTPTLLTASENDTYSGSGIAIAIPTGGATVYIGASDVTTATGFPLAAGDRVTLDLQSDLPSTVANASIITSASRMYAALIP